MKAYEMFQEMKPETAVSVFQYLRDEQREVYSASLASLARIAVYASISPRSVVFGWSVCK